MSLGVDARIEIEMDAIDRFHYALTPVIIVTICNKDGKHCQLRDRTHWMPACQMR